MKNKKLKLIVMIPCLNEEKTLPLVIKTIPRRIPGIRKIETLVIDDGSTDDTGKIARKLKVNYVIRHTGNRGLAYSFADGINYCLEKGADIIVNTDGDNQYPQEDIPQLIKPILEGKVEIVIANRQTDKIRDFSFVKKVLQKLGSRVVRAVSGTDVPDAVSGFRAYSREAALQMNIVSDFSYTIETIIQAGKKRIPITSIPIKVNRRTRGPRLYGNIWVYLKKSAATIVRIFTMYEPLKFFSYIGASVFLLGVALVVRFLYYLFIKEGGGHVQSLILASIFILIGFQIGITGLLADLIAGNRKLIEGFVLGNKKNKKT